MTSRPDEIDETGRALVAARLAADQAIPIETASAMADDVLNRREDSPHYAVVVAALNTVLKMRAGLRAIVGGRSERATPPRALWCPAQQPRCARPTRG